ncbi:hypothetical protein GJ496_004282 [Pomphorhynchus laevis]|nr:hypothetical protein GJ496_004282 [Pomphorhynchus laevis]
MDDLKNSLRRLADLPENEIRLKAVEDAFAPFGEKLSSPNRALVGEGILAKVCKKKLKRRAFFLFTDILVYGKIILHKSVKKYNGQQIFDLRDAHVESILDTGDVQNAFNVFSPKKSFTLMAISQREKQDWITHLEKCIMYCNGGFLPQLGSEEVDPNVRAPVWIRDNSATGCMCCNKKFTVVIRRHHCRSCGRVVCANCSKGRFLLTKMSSEPQRVCDVCLVKLKQTEYRHSNEEDSEYNDESDNIQSNKEYSSDSDAINNNLETKRSVVVSTFYGSVDDPVIGSHDDKHIVQNVKNEDNHTD